MKNIIAIVIVISSLAIFLSKKLELYSSWRKVSANIISIKKILNGKNISEVRYVYKIGEKEYEGFFTVKDKLDVKENEKLSIYYHWLNPELSVRGIPTNYEDILLLIISIIGGLYLYFYSCEKCDEISVIKDLIKFELI